MPKSDLLLAELIVHHKFVVETWDAQWGQWRPHGEWDDLLEAEQHYIDILNGCERTRLVQVTTTTHKDQQRRSVNA